MVKMIHNKYFYVFQVQLVMQQLNVGYSLKQKDTLDTMTQGTNNVPMQLNCKDNYIFVANVIIIICYEAAYYFK